MKQKKYSANALVGFIVFIAVGVLLYNFFINSQTGPVTDEQTTVKRVNETYKMLNDALAQAILGHGVRIEQWYTDNTNENAANTNLDRKTLRIAQNLFEGLQISKTCGIGGNCFSMAQPSSILGLKLKPFRNKSYNAIMSNGVSVGVICNEVYCTIYFDIDGPKNGKNIYGVDIFSVMLNPGVSIKKLVTGTTEINDADENESTEVTETNKPNEISDTELENACKGVGKAPDSNSCTAYVLKNQNLSYARNILK